MSRTQTVIPPATALLKGLRAIGYSFSTAVADIIDNSITAQATWVKLYFDPLAEVPYFLIFDNGYGMNFKELQNAMLFGSNRDDKIDCEEDLGRFGLGLKSASLSQCRKFIVISKRFGRINAMSYDLDEIEKSNSWDLQILGEDEICGLPFIDELKTLDSGTIVIWNKFDKLEKESGDKFELSFRNTVDAMKKHVEYVFHRFYDSVEITLNKKRIERRDPFLESSLKAQHGRKTIISIKDCARPIEVIPHTLPYANQLTDEEKTLLGNPKSIYDDQGFYLYRNRRLISWGSWMRMGIRSELNKLARIRVDIPSSLDSVWMLDVKKSSAKIPDKIKDYLKIAVEDSVVRSKRTVRNPGVKEATPTHNVWERITERDGNVRYEIDRTNPLIQGINKTLSGGQRELFEGLLVQLEQSIPKYRIHNDVIEISDMKSYVIEKSNGRG